MSGTVHAFDFLAESAEKLSVAAVCVVFGDEPLLKRLVLARLRGAVVGTEEDEVPFATFSGESVEWRDVRDELSTLSLFGGGRKLAVVDDADQFVSRYRQELEDYVARPASGGVLILDVGAWKANTRLYKAIDQQGMQIQCCAPQKKAGKRNVLDERRLCQWIAAWAKSHHKVAITMPAVELMLDLAGTELGLLDQELAKLALFVPPGGKVTPETVRDVVGGWRTRSTWELIDRAVEGNADEALRQLDHLLQSGEQPVALLGQIAWSLRRFAAATRIYQQAEHDRRRVALSDALVQAGFRKWPPEAIKTAERQLKALGRQRAGKLYRWLLDADLALKGTHSQPNRARLVLERLFVRMSRQLAPVRRR